MHNDPPPSSAQQEKGLTAQEGVLSRSPDSQPSSSGGRASSEEDTGRAEEGGERDGKSRSQMADYEQIGQTSGTLRRAPPRNSNMAAKASSLTPKASSTRLHLPPLPTSATQTNLPQPGDVFPSSRHFLAACRDGSNVVYGHSMWQNQKEANTAVSTCRYRPDKGCQMKISAVRSDRSWVVTSAGSIYTHDHSTTPETASSSRGGSQAGSEVEDDEAFSESSPQALDLTGSNVDPHPAPATASTAPPSSRPTENKSCSPQPTVQASFLVDLNRHIPDKRTREASPPSLNQSRVNISTAEASSEKRRKDKRAKAVSPKIERSHQEAPEWLVIPDSVSPPPVLGARSLPPSVARFSSSLPSPIPSSSVPPFPLTASALPFPEQLRLFLISLHPSLGACAELFISAGITDLPLLVSFVGMLEKTREKLVLEAKLSLLQRHQLRTQLGEAMKSA